MTQAASQRVSPLEVRAGPELFFGIVSPTGTEIDLVCRLLEKHLTAVGYATVPISISELIDSVTGSEANKLPQDERIRRLMKEGTALRKRTGANDICARLAVSGVRDWRLEKNSNGNIDSLDKKKKEDLAKKPLPRTAYVFRSLKTPEEVETLRDVYGRAFNLISVYTSERKRRESLAERIARSHKDTDTERYLSIAQELITNDREENDPSGQNVQDTFPMADVFFAHTNVVSLEAAVRRFVRLLFGDPFITPSKDEYGMFAARAAAVRSADLARQVGASILSSEGQVIAAGCNEVPKFGGGQYWEGDEKDARDFRLGQDASVTNRRDALAELLNRFAKSGWLSDAMKNQDPADLAEKMFSGEYKSLFSGSQVLSVIEYGRSVHAEMAAITDAALRGISLRGLTLYTTTFPCHICARHIVSSGLSRVVYVEPYPKSKAEQLYPDSIAVNPAHKPDNLLSFDPFVGISPNRYLEYFPTLGDRKDGSGRPLDWDNKSEKNPRLKRFVLSYLLIEDEAVKDLGVLSNP